MFCSIHRQFVQVAPVKSMSRGLPVRRAIFRGRAPLVCLADMPVIPDYLSQLERERPDLHFTCLGPGQEWLLALKTWIIPALHRQQTLGECPSLEASVQALERFIQDNAPDPFLWKSA
jgi:hypothetical protein